MALSMGLLGKARPLTEVDQAQMFDWFMRFRSAWNEIEQRLPAGYDCAALQEVRHHHVTAARIGQAEVVADWLKANPGWRPPR